MIVADRLFVSLKKKKQKEREQEQEKQKILENGGLIISKADNN